MERKNISSASELTASPPLRCRVVQSDPEWSLLAENWRDLSERCFNPSPFKSWDWVSVWWRHFGAAGALVPRARALYVIVVESVVSGEVLGIVPLHYDTGSAFSVKPCRLELIGICGLAQTLNEEPILLLRHGSERDALQAALQHLYSPQCQVAWDFLALDVTCSQEELLLGGPPTRAIQQRCGSFWEQGSYAGCLIARPGTQWEPYRRSLSKSMRDNTAYYPKRLAKHGRTMQVRFITAPQEFGPAIDQLIELHGRRAGDTRGLSHVNHISGSVQRAMLQEILTHFAHLGTAFLGVLEIDGKVAAMQAYLQQDDAILFYYSGHDPKWFEYSPLTLLSVAVIQKAMAEGVPCLNFLTGRMPWKERWAAQPESVVQTLFCASGSLRSTVLASARQGLHWARTAKGLRSLTEGKHTHESMV